MSQRLRLRFRIALLAVAGLFAVCGSIAAAGSPATRQPENARVTGLPIVHIRQHPDALPVVAVVAQDTTVLSDFVVPYGVLAQSGAATVIALNMTDHPLKAGPLTLLPDMTVAAFDKVYPDGADYVIVPATADKHAEETTWLRAQRAHGAALVSICDGVELLAEIGALDGRHATGHWASLGDRRKQYPQVAWLTNLRYVADGDVASSAGVSAALPISLALVETIAGPQTAHATADRLGVASWEAAHDSDMFKVLPTDRATHRANMRVKREDVVALQVQDDDDEVALSLHAEAWSRTMRNEVRLVSDTAGPVRLRGGLRVQAQATSSSTPDVRIVVAEAAPAGKAFPAAFDLIAQRYGSGTARLSALGMEYPWGDLKAAR
ncbi:DJ-1/PfpI family protein [Xanthomonas sp. NCPPB 2654]|uniref:DJ-1/PfpI family protein n=1 Tax=unclassified Xanthomonas TaxID=2643310 RepID=UPI0021DF4457|nr:MULTISPECIES: DJ-1/PfpI family protein [unclassified Xanthomonas]MDL5364742.1 DJ-1/PfpI family protein [Xanthomonas sp. NCPPB 2654]UYC22053.1 DJ-1/PfpI family protein [Xanthomonas sp. CFBP 8443]